MSRLHLNESMLNNFMICIKFPPMGLHAIQIKQSIIDAIKDYYYYYYYYYNNNNTTTFCEFFTTMLADSLSLESEWQQVSSSFLDSSQYSGWS